MAIPFIKWPGGKRWAYRYLQPLIVRDLRGVYYEPFVGGGAMFFLLAPQQAVIADINEELINVYVCVRDLHEDVRRLLQTFPVSSEFYYKIRGDSEGAAVYRAARFLYLNRTCFGGVYRTNKKGNFNVPFGGGQRCPKCLVESSILSGASEALNNTVIKCQDFLQTIRMAGKGDVVYCDPAYTVAHGKNGFLRFNESIFSWEDQVRLRDAAFDARERGSTVIISNADHPSLLELYNGEEMQKVSRFSCIARDRNNRKSVDEIIIILRGY